MELEKLVKQKEIPLLFFWRWNADFTQIACGYVFRGKNFSPAKILSHFQN
jgi:hypothetical protein